MPVTADEVTTTAWAVEGLSLRVLRPVLRSLRSHSTVGSEENSWSVWPRPAVECAWPLVASPSELPLPPIAEPCPPRSPTSSLYWVV